MSDPEIQTTVARNSMTIVWKLKMTGILVTRCAELDSTAAFLVRVANGQASLSFDQIVSLAKVLSVEIDCLLIKTNDTRSRHKRMEEYLVKTGRLKDGHPLRDEDSILVDLYPDVVEKINQESQAEEETMLDSTFEKKIQKAATRLADDLDCELQHDLGGYDRLLCEAAQQNFNGDHIDFSTVARAYCFGKLKLSEPNRRQVFATTTLAVSNQLGSLVGDLERDSEVSSGLLAHLKNGQDDSLKPVCMVYLADGLKVPISLLAQDFSDNPEGLRKELIACGAIELGVSEADTTNEEVDSVADETADETADKPDGSISAAPKTLEWENDDVAVWKVPQN